MSIERSDIKFEHCKFAIINAQTSLLMPDYSLNIKQKSRKSLIINYLRLEIFY